ncbi:type I restriction enzyme HsdR N-terminal domain-containing protein [Variovorax sp. LjRoot175]|uniref:hypothetical protein n=1 Tax=Variovorax sp. LjRoot175 TaxID=3342276 RepID=UPI003ED0D61A
MEFPIQPFDAMTEADVREEIIAPLLRYLGYRRGTEHNIIREQSLTYDRIQLGRRKATDPLLRGRADYICEAGRKVRWVVEAKAPSAPLDAETEAQAWSYANHSEVKAVYFVLTNGRQFRLHETSRGPGVPPLFDLTYEDLPDNLQAIVNTLGPEGLLRTFPDVVIDRGVPLGPGLGSIARVSSGRMKVERMEPAVAPVHELVTTIIEGHVQRGPNGGIVVAYRTQASIESLQAFNATVGLNAMLLLSHDKTISTNELQPNTLMGGRECLVSRGTPTFDINTWKAGELPFDARIRYSVEASGCMTGLAFHGTFVSAMQMEFLFPDRELPPLEFVAAGKFEIHLA